MEVKDKLQAPVMSFFWERLLLDRDQMYLAASEGVQEKEKKKISAPGQN